jgi:hypothetical protein
VGWTPVLALLGTPIVLYVPLLGYRWDYLSHFLIGAGAVVGLVGLSRLAGWTNDAVGVATAAAVLVAGTYAEHAWFGALVFDWADIGAGGLGACCAAVALLGDRDGPDAGGLVVLAVVTTLAGLVLRFGVGGPH